MLWQPSTIAAVATPLGAGGLGGHGGGHRPGFRLVRSIRAGV